MMIAFFKRDSGAHAPPNLRHRRLHDGVTAPNFLDPAVFARIDTPVVDEVKGLDRIVYGLTLTLSGMSVGVSAR